ncbi:tetratricopeptide repeat protein [Winogradskyella sp. 3972H.M.0a.05]|uniref:tetratricopeptide repeat-containing sensor histidine kinase n=1 Tax=Winogradskyella sp. 3972H.M.0a.05 TaxID=2950277 RepID=UPI0033950B21
MKKTSLLIALMFTFSTFSQSKVEQKIDSLKNVYETKTEPLIKYSVLYDVGRYYISVNIDSSITIFKRVVKEARKIDSDTLQVKALIGLGLAYSDQKELDSAQVFYERAEKIMEDVDHTALESSLYNNKGIMFFYKSDYESARKAFEGVLEVAKRTNNLDDMSRSYNNMALCYSYLGKYEDALDMHIESAKIAEQLNDKIGVAKSYNNIGLLYRDLEDYDKSEEYLLKSLEIKKVEGSKVDMISSYLNLGGTLRKIGIKDKDTSRLLKARDYYDEALELSNEANYKNGKNIAYVNLALVETTLGNYKKGIEYGKISLNNSLEAGDPHTEMVSRVNLGDAYRYSKQFQLAEEHLVRGYEMAKEQSLLYNQKETALILSLLNSDQGKYKPALEYYKEYYTLTDSISSTEVQNKVNELETKYDTEKKEKQILIQRAELAEQDLLIQKRNYQIYGLSGFALLLALMGYLFYNQQKLKNQQLQKENELKDALIKIETQNRLQEQRLRISRDLHDNIGAQLTFIISSLDNLKYGFKLPDKLSDKLTGISSFTSSTIQELRDTIWAMNKNDIDLDDLQSRISNFIEKAKTANENVAFQFALGENLSEDIKFSSVKGMNIYRIIQEAVNNSLKYAEAKSIKVNFETNDEDISFSIADDGKGFEPNDVEGGNGLNNMKKRAQELEGTIRIESEENKGTTIAVTIPK